MASTGQCVVAECQKAAFARSWCTKHYTRWKRHGSVTARMPGEVVNGCRVCPGCGADKALGEYGNAAGRCRPCMAEAARRRRAVRPDPPTRVPFDATCGNCGSAFMADKRRWRYCSPECSFARKYRDNWKNVAHRRIKERGATVERFSREEIFERDEWTCRLCNEAIDPAARKPDMRCASVDHIVPISKGGEHSRANVQAAHFICNLTKGDRILEGVA